MIACVFLGDYLETDRINFFAIRLLIEYLVKEKISLALNISGRDLCIT